MYVRLTLHPLELDQFVLGFILAVDAPAYSHLLRQENPTEKKWGLQNVLRFQCAQALVPISFLCPSEN